MKKLLAVLLAGLLLVLSALPAIADRPGRSHGSHEHPGPDHSPRPTRPPLPLWPFVPPLAPMPTKAPSKSPSVTWPSGKTYYVVNTVNVRSGPSADDYPKIGSLFAGGTVLVYGFSGNWALIKFKDQWAYVSKNFLSDTKPVTEKTPAAAPAAAPAVAVIKPAQLKSTTPMHGGEMRQIIGEGYLRTGPNTTFGYIFILQGGDYVEVVEIMDDWAYVFYNPKNQDGWISIAELEEK